MPFRARCARFVPIWYPIEKTPNLAQIDTKNTIRRPAHAILHHLNAKNARRRSNFAHYFRRIARDGNKNMASAIWKSPHSAGSVWCTFCEKMHEMDHHPVRAARRVEELARNALGARTVPCALWITLDPTVCDPGPISCKS